MKNLIAIMMAAMGGTNMNERYRKRLELMHLYWRRATSQKERHLCLMAMDVYEHLMECKGSHSFAVKGKPCNHFGKFNHEPSSGV